jgi:DNA-binding SARP family transcriptional activator/energy-coupling factor transporter ATP-binding protein EcfA2
VPAGGPGATAIVLVADTGAGAEEAVNWSPAASESSLRATAETWTGAVTNDGGGQMVAVFSEAQNALMAAVAMLQAAEDAGRTPGIRIGLTLGMAVLEDGVLHGAAAVEAARLCAVADANQILCSDAVRLAAGKNGGYRYRASDTFRREDLPGPVAYAVESAPTTTVPGSASASVDCDFGVLGPLVLRRRSGPVDIGGLKEQTLLAVLLARVNQVVSADSLIEEIWGERAPRTAAKTLQGYVARLRQAIEPDRPRGAAPAVLVTSGAGYQLRVVPSRVDAARFEQLVAKAARERAAGDWAGAAASLRTGLGLWRGDPYGDYLDAPACLAEAERLRELQQRAVENRIEADLAMGRAPEVVAELERLVRDYPIRERLWGQLMVALYRCGRQTEALRAYQRARSVLVEEMGIEPGAELRQLEAAVLAQDPALAVPAGVSPGGERGPGLPPALEAVGPSFVGRAPELVRLANAWREATTGRGGLVTIFGPKGAGKTRLVAELARRANAEGSIVCYAHCTRDHHTPDAVVEQLVAEGGLSPGDIATGPGPAVGLARVLAGWALDKPLLAVVEDLDEADADTVAFVAGLGPACADLPVLVIATASTGQERPLAPLDRLDPTGAAVHLGGLNLTEVDALGVLYMPEEWSTADGEGVLRITGGIPRSVHEHVSELARARVSRGLAEAAEQAELARRDLHAVQAGIAERVVGLRAVEERRRSHLRPVASEDRIDQAPLTCPYKGLARFEAEDAPFFFGRERLVATLTARLIGADLLVVTGPSGSGKSSLVRAGLLPALAEGALPGSQSWQVVVLCPGAHPADELRRRLAVAPGAASGSRRVVFVDQLEELFTACDQPGEREEFVADLLGMGSADQPTTVIVAVRSDELGRCAEHPELAERMAGNDVLVGPMSDDELRRAVEGPARRCGLEIEPGLAGAVATDVADRPAALPLLSTALLETWERRQGRRLSLADYRQAGGVEGAVARLAESAYARMNPGQQRAARRLLLQLADVRPGGQADLRRRAPLTEILSADDADAAVALDILVARRLVTVGEGTAEVTHEALLREWPRLKDWLEADMEGRRLHRHMVTQAAAWEESGRHASELLRGPRLAAALDWAEGHRDDLGPREAVYLESSRAEAERETTEAHLRADEQLRVNRRLRRRLTLLAVVTAVAVVAGVLAVNQSNRADAVARRADALRMATEAVATPATQLDRALLVARQAWQLDDSSETRSALLTVLQRSPVSLASFPAWARASTPPM